MFEYSKPREEQFTKQPTLSTPQSSAEGRRSRSSSDLDNNIQTVLEMRKGFYEWMFPFPSWCRQCGWVVLVLWVSAACVIAMVYGLSFDMNYIEKDNEHSALFSDEN